MRNKLFKYLIYFLIFIFVFITGISIGVACKNWPNLTLKHEVDLVALFTSLFSMAITLLAAYWVTTVLERNKDISRFEKELIISRATSFDNFIESSFGFIPLGQIQYSTAASITKRANAFNDSILNAIAISSISIENGYHKKLQGSLRTIKNLLTDTPVSNTVINPPLAVANGIITYTPSRLLEIENEVDALRGQILSYILFINKS